MSVPPPAPQAADRRARYAAAIAEGFRAFDADTTSDAYLDAELLDAVVAVADAEEAELLAAVPVVPPATNRAALRDRIRRAVCEAEGFGWDTDMLEPDEYGDVADAVLAVLPEAADRAAVLREAADEAETVAESLRKHHEFERSTGALDVMTELRRLAAVSGPCVAGEQQNETPEAEAPTTTKPLLRSTFAARSNDATVDPAMCPRCKGDNQEAFELCAKCAAGVRQDGAQP